MPPGKILGEGGDSYVYDDGGGNVAVVPKSSLDPNGGVVGIWKAVNDPTPVTVTDDGAPPPPAAPGPPPMAMLPDPARGTGIASAAPMPQPTPMAVNAALPPPPALVQAPQKPMTPEQTQGAALQQGTQALDQEASATIANGKLEAQAATDKEATLKKRNEDIALHQQAADAQLVEDQNQKLQIKQKLAKAVDAEDNYKVDQNRYYHNMSTGKTVGMYILAAISGLGAMISNKDPTKNPVLEMMDAENAKDVNAQLDERAQLGKKTTRIKGDLATASTDSGDHQAQFYKRMAVLSESAARQLEQAAAHYAAPEAQNNAQMAAAGMRLKKAEYIEKAGDKQWQQQNTEKQQTLQDNRAQQQIGLGYANLAETKRKNIHDEQRADEALKIEAAKIAQKGDTEQAAAVAERGIGGVATPVRDPETGEVTGVTNDILRNKDGSGWTAATKERAEKIYAAKNSTDDLVNIFDQVRTIGVGWKSDTAKGKELQQIRTLWAEAKVAVKNKAALGALSESDYKLMDDLVGTDDPTAWRDGSAGIEMARKRVLQSFNTMLRNDKYTGADYSPPDMGAKPAPEQTDIDKRQAQVSTEPSSIPGWMTPLGSQIKSATETAQVTIVKNEVANYRDAKSSADRKAIAQSLANTARPADLGGAKSEAVRNAATQALIQINIDENDRNKEQTSTSVSPRGGLTPQEMMNRTWSNQRAGK